MYGGIRKTNIRQDIDRGQWADLDRVLFECVMEGTGEYLMEEPMYFARAYEKPPFFTYSLVQREAQSRVPYNPTVYPHPEVTLGLSGEQHCGFQAQYFPDGSFEHQMIWNDPFIPSWDQNTIWPEYQKILDDGASTPPAVSFPYFTNCWIQEPWGTGRWSISTEQIHAPDMGPKGKYSAKATTNANGETPWLVPIFPDWDSYNQPMDSASAADRWRRCYSHSFQVNPDYSRWTDAQRQSLNSQWLFMPSNPIAGEYVYRLWVYPTSSCYVEQDWLLWANDSIAVDVYENSQTSKVLQPNEWNLVEFFESAPRWIYPNSPNQELQPQPDPNSGPGEYGNTLNAYYNWTVVRWRIAGASAGASIYIDDVVGQPRLRPVLAPIVTIGVAEWVMDDHDMVVGARLWFKVGLETELYKGLF